MAPGDLVRRLSVAAIGIPIALGVLFLGGWYLTGAIAGLGLLAHLEMQALIRARGLRAFSVVGAVGTVGLVALAGWTREFQAWAPWALATVLALFFLASALTLRYRATDDRPLLVATLTVSSVLYWGACLAFAVFLWFLPETSAWPEAGRLRQGPVLLAFPLAVTWMADTAAYLVGHLVGRRKLAPKVSPGKTVEGGIASLTTAVLVAAFMGWGFLAWTDDAMVRILVGGGMGLIMGITVQLGDLIESHFKREAGVKDSGALLPGHGGILDRFDALVFTLPLTYALLHLVIRLT